MINAIFERKSIRAFTQEPVTNEQIQEILKAGMAGPSAVNSRDWSFIVITDKKTLQELPTVTGSAHSPLLTAAFAVLICGDIKRSYKTAEDFYIIDCSIAGQNMLLTAHDLGLGGVWLGTWPIQSKVDAVTEYFHLPEGIKAHSLFAFGHPAAVQPRERSPRPEWDEERIHYEKW